MILHEFNNGWGNQWPLKQFEQTVVKKLLRPWVLSDKKVVVINSVWYTGDYHQQVCDWLSTRDWDHLILIAMLDAAVPKPDWYEQFQRPVTAIGYYPGPGAVDFCALFVDEFLKTESVPDLDRADTVQWPFMCLMRKPHWHRVKLYKKLVAANLVSQGLVSMGADNGQALATLSTDTVHDNLAPNADSSHYGVPNDIVSLGHPDNWRGHFLNIVAETFYDINLNNFVSEKIYKPIVGHRPFLVYDPDGATAWLGDRKFESFVNDFKDISNLDLTQPANLVPFLSVLCAQPPQYWQQKFVALQPKLLYNRSRFKQYVVEQKQIVEQGIPCQI